MHHSKDHQTQALFEDCDSELDENSDDDLLSSNESQDEADLLSDEEEQAGNHLEFDDWMPGPKLEGDFGFEACNSDHLML